VAPVQDCHHRSHLNAGNPQYRPPRRLTPDRIGGIAAFFGENTFGGFRAQKLEGKKRGEQKGEGVFFH
jgi:hypothetical protein